MNLKNEPLEEGFMTLLNTLGAVINLLRTLAIIIIVYYVLRWLVRIFAPILMKRMVNKMQEKAQQQQQQYNQQRQNTTKAKEGETVIDRKPSSPKQSNDDVGEYVDFEEID
jgi:hypothetical protein